MVEHKIQYNPFYPSFCHSWWRRSFAWEFLSLLKAPKRSMPRKILSKFIPAIPNKASGSSTPCPNLWASLMSLAVMRMWDTTLAKMKVTQLSIHSNFTILLLASRIPAIRLTFLTCRNIECSCIIRTDFSFGYINGSYRLGLILNCPTPRW